MTRVADPEKLPIYSAAGLFVERALAADDSLFSKGIPIWTSNALEELKTHFVDHPDESSDRFEVKLEKQLRAAPPAVVQLMAEMLYVYFLASVTVGADRKRALIEQVLSWSSTPVQIPDELAPALATGLAAPGTAFNTQRPWLLEFLIRFVGAWKQEPAERRRALLGDPWEFKAFVFSLPIHAAQTQREALLHLVHPEAFEPIVSVAMKERIAEQLGHLASPATTDVDRRLAEIRAKLAREHGEFNFWDPAVASLWQVDSSPWGQFVTWAKRFHEHPGFDAAERTYKLEIAAELQHARHALVDGAGDWRDLLRRAINSPRNNLTAWQAHSRLVKWCETAGDRARDALHRLWTGRDSLEDRVAAFVESIREAGITLNTGISIASTLLMADEPTERPPYRSTVFEKGYELTKAPRPQPKAGAGERYAHAMRFLDDLTREAGARGLELRDRLDAQSVLWAVLKGDLPVAATPKEKRALERYRGGVVELDDDDGEGDTGPPGDPSLAHLADRLLLDAPFLQRVERLLRDKRQVVFHGPPGTGKTFVAMEIARHFAESSDGVVLVQFHPSYSYEDFVEGYRPAPPVAGQAGFTLREGPLKALARRATAAPDRTFVLVIDELNRANIAKVFGELYFLLEYRDEAIRLQYSDEPFQLPKNLWFIATMNTADRSIALVDAALRRRFHFVPFFPDQPPIQGLLARWLAKQNTGLSWVSDAVDLVNRDLDDRNLAVGPSHFLRHDLDEEWVGLIWEHSVMPYLEEQMLGEHERLRRFWLDAVRERLRPEGREPEE